MCIRDSSSVDRVNKRHPVRGARGSNAQASDVAECEGPVDEQLTPANSPMFIEFPEHPALGGELEVPERAIANPTKASAADGSLLG